MNVWKTMVDAGKIWLLMLLLARYSFHVLLTVNTYSESLSVM